MRTRLARLAPLALSLTLLAGCHNAPSTKVITLNVGNMVATATATKVTSPQLLVTYGSGRASPFGIYLATSGEGFQIQTTDGWYELESAVKLEVERIDGTDRILLWDSTGADIKLESEVTGAEDAFDTSSAAAHYVGVDGDSGMHAFEITILYKDAIHSIAVRAKA